jgi:hypothetical protein
LYGFAFLFQILHSLCEIELFAMKFVYDTCKIPTFQRSRRTCCICSFPVEKWHVRIHPVPSVRTREATIFPTHVQLLQRVVGITVAYLPSLLLLLPFSLIPLPPLLLLPFQSNHTEASRPSVFFLKKKLIWNQHLDRVYVTTNASIRERRG